MVLETGPPLWNRAPLFHRQLALIPNTQAPRGRPSPPVLGEPRLKDRCFDSHPIPRHPLPTKTHSMRRDGPREVSSLSPYSRPRQVQRETQPEASPNTLLHRESKPGAISDLGTVSRGPCLEETCLGGCRRAQSQPAHPSNTTCGVRGPPQTRPGPSILHAVCTAAELTSSPQSPELFLYHRHPRIVTGPFP